MTYDLTQQQPKSKPEAPAQAHPHNPLADDPPVAAVESGGPDLGPGLLVQPKKFQYEVSDPTRMGIINVCGGTDSAGAPWLLHADRAGSQEPRLRVHGEFCVIGSTRAWTADPPLSDGQHRSALWLWLMLILIAARTFLRDDRHVAGPMAQLQTRHCASASRCARGRAVQGLLPG